MVYDDISLLAYIGIYYIGYYDWIWIYIYISVCVCDYIYTYLWWDIPGSSCLTFSLPDGQCPRFIPSSLFSWWGGYAIMEPMAKVECLGFVRMVPELIEMANLKPRKPLYYLHFLMYHGGFLLVCRSSRPIEPSNANSTAADVAVAKA